MQEPPKVSWALAGPFGVLPAQRLTGRLAYPVPDRMALVIEGQMGYSGSGCIGHPTSGSLQMEYAVRSGNAFEQIEARVMEILACQGLLVRRSFSLRSAARGLTGSPSQDVEAGEFPGFSVLWLYASGASRQPHGLLTLYQRQGQTFFHVGPAAAVRPPAMTPGTDDLEADLVAALVLAGLDVCLVRGEGRRCVDAADLADGIADGHAEVFPC